MNANSGYVGYSMSIRAYQAREAGELPKTDFKRIYGIDPSKYISHSSWHHTSKHFNKTYFYSIAELMEHIAELDYQDRQVILGRGKFRKYWNENKLPYLADKYRNKELRWNPNRYVIDNWGGQIVVKLAPTASDRDISHAMRKTYRLLQARKGKHPFDNYVYRADKIALFANGDIMCREGNRQLKYSDINWNEFIFNEDGSGATKFNFNRITS